MEDNMIQKIQFSNFWIQLEQILLRLLAAPSMTAKLFVLTWKISIMQIFTTMFSIMLELSIFELLVSETLLLAIISWSQPPRNLLSVQKNLLLAIWPMRILQIWEFPLQTIYAKVQLAMDLSSLSSLVIIWVRLLIVETLLVQLRLDLFSIKLMETVWPLQVSMLTLAQ